MLIDTHAHVDRVGAPVSRLLDEMKKAGVGRAVLVQTQLEQDACDYLIEVLERYPAQFAGVFLLQPRSHHAPHRLYELAKKIKVAGVQLRPGLEPRQTWLNSPQTLPLWEEFRELKIPVCLLIRSHQYNQLSDIVTDFPDIPIVLDHLGQGPETRKVVPQYLPVLLEYSRYAQVFVKISKLFQLSRQPHPHEDLWPALEQICKRFGAQRLIWGSDYPTVRNYCGYKKEAELLDKLPFLNARDRNWIKHKTAESLWF